MDVKDDAKEVTQTSGSVYVKQELHNVVKGIHDELESATNPSLVPQKLHDLKMKLRNMVHELAAAVEAEAQKVEKATE